MIYTVTLNPTIDRTLKLDSILSVGNMNRGELENVVGGGKGLNCAEAATLMGADAAAYCILGKDNAAEFERCVEHLACKIRPYFKNGYTRTCLKVFDTNGTMTELNEKGSKLTGTEMKGFLEMLVSDIQKGGKPDFVLLSGSIPQGADDGLYAAMIALLSRLGISVMLDCDGEALKKGIAASPFLVKPNLPEFEAFVGYEFEDLSEIAQKASEVAKQYKTKVLVTLGADGMIYSDGETILRVTTPETEASAPVGAGDTVLGVLAAALSKGLPMDKALLLSGACACAKVNMTPGSFPRQMDAAKYLTDVYVTPWQTNTEDTEQIEISEK